MFIAPSAPAETLLTPYNPEIDQLLRSFDTTSNWYAQRSAVQQIPVLGSAQVSSAQMLHARRVTARFLAKLPTSTVRELRHAGLKVVVIGPTEHISDVPAIGSRFGPDGDRQYWAGSGATPDLPLCVATSAHFDQPWVGENLMIFGLATSLAELVLLPDRPGFRRDLDRAFAHARSRGRWANTHAAASPGTYWAEGVQSYFNANREGPRRGDGVHGAINTRRELAARDPALYRLIAQNFLGG